MSTASNSETDAPTRRRISPVTFIFTLSIAAAFGLALLGGSVADDRREAITDKYGTGVVVPEGNLSTLDAAHEWTIDDEARLCTYALSDVLLKCLDADGVLVEVPVVAK